jgi:hypothetical protein
MDDDAADSNRQGNGLAKGHHKTDDADSLNGNQKDNGAAKGHHKNRDKGQG